ncbi:MAG: redoxin domain-containing protein, partial [Conexivisphaerales archaeon]
ADVIGISPDNLETHKRYSTELGLDYELVTDNDGSMASIYGVLVKTNPPVFKRSAFLISPQMMLVKSYINGKISFYAYEILKDLRFIKGLNNKLEINDVTIQ